MASTAQTLDEAVAELLPLLVDLRHDLHSHPEIAYHEVRTQAQCQKILCDHGIDPALFRKSTVDTGFFFDLHGQAPAATGSSKVKRILLRTDMDALGMTEDNPSLPYVSQNKGFAHMCGHDGHMAVMVGAACMVQKAIRKIPANLCVRFVFQPAEEAAHGSKVVIGAGCLDDVDEVYALHCWPFGFGQIRVIDGPTMAQITRFNVVFRGVGAHGSEPQYSVDPVVAACSAITSLQTIVSRNVPPLEKAVVTVAMVSAGEACNVIPDTASFSGTIRTLTPQVYETVSRRFREICEGTCLAYGTKLEKLELNVMHSPLTNSTEPYSAVVRAAHKVSGVEAVSSEKLPLMGSEDFSDYTAAKPGCMFFLGMGDGSGKPSNHMSCFNFDDRSLPVGVRMWVRIVEDRLGVSLFP